MRPKPLDREVVCMPDASWEYRYLDAHGGVQRDPIEESVAIWLQRVGVPARAVQNGRLDLLLRAADSP